MVASTNHLDKLDAGLSSRPSRFDRKYLFPLPSEAERELYCQYWRTKLKARKIDVEFPKKICPAVAVITDEFSFAYIQEAFVATLLAIALKRSESIGEDVEKLEGGGHKGDKDLNDYELWREMKKTVKALRDDMGSAPGKSSIPNDLFENAFSLEKEAQASNTAVRGQIPGPLNLAERPGPRPMGENSQVRGMAVEIDHQGVPIMADGNRFLYIPES